MSATIATPGGAAVSNSAVVDVGDATLVFDTMLTPRAAEDLATAALELTGRRPTLAANSHWHLDHILGNSVFSSLPIYATRRTREILLEKRVELEGELKPEALARDVSEIERQLKAGDPGVSAELLALNRALLEDAANLRLTPPTRVFESKFRLPSQRRVELVSWGSGHTESDSVLFLPDEGILYAGDLVLAGVHPSTGSGDPEHWLTVLDEIDRLHPERIVPGHGPVSSGAVVGEMREYLTTVLRVASAPDPHEMPAKYATWGFRESFEQSIRFVRSRPTPR
ncbi:MAG: MBL fold metallo-hydrolase [Thermoplasmata archaeon]|nr:MBL fold metallo-hydrolase [Thermoplasmata archaeon]